MLEWESQERTKDYLCAKTELTCSIYSTARLPFAADTLKSRPHTRQAIQTGALYSTSIAGFNDLLLTS